MSDSGHLLRLKAISGAQLPEKKPIEQGVLKAPFGTGLAHSENELFDRQETTE